MKARSLIIPVLALVIIVAIQTLTPSSLGHEALQTQTAAPDLARNSGCFECHSIDKKVTGPAYKDVADRYKGDANARAALIETLKNGGKGKWTKVTGGVPMPPFSPRLSDAEIARLVDWVLSLKTDD